MSNEERVEQVVRAWLDLEEYDKVPYALRGLVGCIAFEFEEMKKESAQ